jgi:hypothetical protein|nr:MAG TPA: excisionase [Caudoviricetes sp.]
MTDEEYVFRSECADRKRVARGSFNKRSHAGKGGRVKMPSDYMTKKERDKMNGEVQSYNLNSPMKWAQFKRMPDDIKREYLSTIISKYNPQQKALAEMFGVSRNTVCSMFKELGIPFRSNVSEVRTGRNDAFWAWVNSTNEVMQDVSEEPLPVVEVATPTEPVIKPAESPRSCPVGVGIPINGVLEFSNTTAQDAFNAAYALLTTAELQKLVITWEAAHE